MLSQRTSLVRLIKLLDELSISKEEASLPELNLAYDQNINSFTWNQELDLSKSISIDEGLISLIIQVLDKSSTPESKKLLAKFDRASV